MGSAVETMFWVGVTVFGVGSLLLVLLFLYNYFGPLDVEIPAGLLPTVEVMETTVRMPGGGELRAYVIVLRGLTLVSHQHRRLALRCVLCIWTSERSTLNVSRPYEHDLLPDGATCLEQPIALDGFGVTKGNLAFTLTEEVRLLTRVIRINKAEQKPWWPFNMRLVVIDQHSGKSQELFVGLFPVRSLTGLGPPTPSGPGSEVD